MVQFSTIVEDDVTWEVSVPTVPKSRSDAETIVQLFSIVMLTPKDDDVDVCPGTGPARQIRQRGAAKVSDCKYRCIWRKPNLL
ncbi:hypothetical protein GCM10007928_36130 [Sulfitobacter porphyrae]|nr:hypothetical protein GCM10007928_36130 [Sulfitobacter porphyrae]